MRGFCCTNRLSTSSACVALARALQRLDQAHRHGFGEGEIGGAAILRGGGGEIAARAERVADQDMHFGRAGIGRLQPARARQRLVALAAAEQGRDQADLGRAVVRRLLGGAADARRTRLRRAGRARRARPAAARRRGRGRARRRRHRRAAPAPGRSATAHKRRRRAGRRSGAASRRRRRDRSSATGRRRAGGGRGGCPAGAATRAASRPRRLLLIAGLEIDRAEQQHAGGRVVEGAAGAVPEAPRELEIARPGGEHRLQIISARMAAGERAGPCGRRRACRSSGPCRHKWRRARAGRRHCPDRPRARGRTRGWRRRGHIGRGSARRAGPAPRRCAGGRRRRGRPPGARRRGRRWRGGSGRHRSRPGCRSAPAASARSKAARAFADVAERHEGAAARSAGHRRDAPARRGPPRAARPGRSPWSRRASASRCAVSIGRHARLARAGELRFRGDAVAERELRPAPA